MKFNKKRPSQREITKGSKIEAMKFMNQAQGKKSEKNEEEEKGRRRVKKKGIVEYYLRFGLVHAMEFARNVERETINKS